MTKDNQKRFSTREIIILIVIILLLASIFFMLYRNIMKNREADDMQLIRNLNTAVALDLSNKQATKHDTMYDAVQACVRHGYVTDRIVAKSNFNIAWESTTGHFVLLDIDEDIVTYPQVSAETLVYDVENKVDYFVVTSAKKYNEKTNTFSGKYAEYSVYAYVGNWPNNLIVSKGFDAGQVKTIAKVSYTNSVDQNVIIRTNGGTLVVDDKSSGEIKHYAKLSSLNVIECHTQSYHEYGEVVFANIKEGHIAFEEDSSIEFVHFETSGTENVNNKDYDTFNTIIVSYADGVEQPDYSRDYVRISPNGTKVCTLSIPEETNNVYLTLNGIYEQVKIEAATIDGNAVADKEWVSTSDATLKTKIASDQISNLYGDRKSALEEGAKTAKVAGANDADGSRELLGGAEKVTEIGKTKEEVENKVYVNDTFFEEIKIDTLSGEDIIKNLTNYGLLENDFKTFYLNKQNFNDFAYGVIYDTKSTDSQSDDELLLQNGRVYTAESETAYKQDDEKYRYWHGDFVVKFNKAIDAYTYDGTSGNYNNTVILAGHYGDWGWLKFPIDKAVSANAEVRLLQSYEDGRVTINYEELCTLVKTFKCGAAYLNEDYDVTSPLTMTIEFRLYETEKPSEKNGNSVNVETGEYVVVDTYTYTFK